MMQKVFITKYFFSIGIIESVMEVSLEARSCYGKPDGFPFYTEFYGTDFHLTKEDAVKDCEKRKEKKLRCLEKQILKIKKMSF
ncbi:hypothetical protein SAMN05443549_11121 [Flavobacterium fluvii]|uniref:Uncharacterized protein n=1 Tax=Flavobacterium fluvii TaxID=468056 RepID=A0A1M5PKT3_9FLAO|nr:hypothetical protein [Flavobacterium fluvii]SHH02371.1 hypothetical protein SAMN05443549_11121 [Flavobacterium fluvii]